MSMWSSMTGLVRVPTDSKVGINKLMESVYDEFNIVNETLPYTEKAGFRTFTFTIVFCMEGVGAAKIVKDFQDAVTKAGMEIIELDANIRFI